METGVASVISTYRNRVGSPVVPDCRSLLDNAVAQVGGQARQAQGRGFATPWVGMAGPRTPRVVMHGRQDG